MTSEKTDNKTPNNCISGGITSYLVNHYHENLRKKLPELILLAANVDFVHKDSMLSGDELLENLLSYMTVIFKHMEKEEQVLFPMIESGQSDKVRFLISTLEDEHKEHSQYLLRIKEMTNNFTPPKEASSIWIALYKGLEDLEKEVEEHVNIEDNILFPRALNSLKP